ncbi:MAG: hypothetical protein KF890_03780 [Nitrospira sp.]|nr:hypothetical protein [Nitrospira sp.]
MDQRDKKPSQQFRRTLSVSEAGARAGASHLRTGAAPAASPKLDRKTFLGDHTQPHSTPPSAGNVWSIKIHDFGKQWVEMSWGKALSSPGKKGEKGSSRNRDYNEARARGRAKNEIRKKCLTIGADHLVTLTYRANIENRDRVLHDLERLRRALSRAGCSMRYVAVLERQQRGALHPHLAVKGFQDVRLLRSCWYRIVGNGQGQVNVKGPRPGSSPVKLARYISKYISKDFDNMPRDFEEHRYFCSLGLRVPTEKAEIVLVRHAKNVEQRMFRLILQETLRRIGANCTLSHWIGAGGTYGWMAGFQDATVHWKLPATTSI